LVTGSGVFGEETPLEEGPEEEIVMGNEFFNNYDTMNLDCIILNNGFVESELSRIPSSTDFDSELANWSTPPFYYSNSPSLYAPRKSGIVRYDEMWTFTDGAFTRGLEMTRAGKLAEQTKLDASVPIQAILCGWNTIDPNTKNHPAWIALRDVDEKVFGKWKSKPQKIAIMYVCSLVMQVRLHCLLPAKKKQLTRGSSV
jgi:hypothetical protein